MLGGLALKIDGWFPDGRCRLDPADASHVVRTEANPANRNLPGGFRAPHCLLPVLRAALDSL